MFRRHRCALALAVSLAALTAPALASDYANPKLLVSAEALETRVPAVGTGVVIIDVRPAHLFAAGHIPGAQPLDPNAMVDPAAPVDNALRPLDEIAQMLGELGVAADREIILYDDKGGFHAARMFWLLEYLGHRRVRLLDGGIQAWSAAGNVLATGPAMAPMPASFTPAVAPRRHASADWIMDRREDSRAVVIDVRPERLYAKGHIPWALNIPWKGNLDADGTFKAPDELLAHFEERGVTPDDNIVVHCQNGLASAHSYVALRLLGYPEVRTYHRSWAEWGAADDLPQTVPGEG